MAGVLDPADPRNVPGDIQVLKDTSTTGAVVAIIQPIPGGPTDLANQAATTSTSNKTMIQTNLTSRLTTVETWITANPSGATLNAAQTLTLMKGIAGLIRLLLNQTNSVGGA